MNHIIIFKLYCKLFFIKFWTAVIGSYISLYICVSTAAVIHKNGFYSLWNTKLWYFKSPCVGRQPTLALRSRRPINIRFTVIYIQPSRPVSKRNYSYLSKRKNIVEQDPRDYMGWYHVGFVVGRDSMATSYLYVWTKLVHINVKWPRKN